jgi:sporulation protein YlmC with PRC-barrel domain
MYASDVLGMMVVDVESGKKIGFVRDIRFSNDNGLIESIIICEGKNKLISLFFYYFKRVEIYRENIVMFGEDLVAVKTY